MMLCPFSPPMTLTLHFYEDYTFGGFGSNHPSKLLSCPFLQSVPQASHTGLLVLPETHPALLPGFSCLFAALFPKPELPPHLPSHLQSNPMQPIIVPWNLTHPASWNHSSLFHDPIAFSLSYSIHSYHAVSSYFSLQLSIGKTWKTGWSHFKVVNPRPISPLFGYGIAHDTTVEINWN